MPQQSDIQKAVVSHLLASDPEIAEIARRIMLKGFYDLEQLQARGNPEVRTAIAKGLASDILEFLKGADDPTGGLRSEFHEMIGEIRGEIMGQEAGGDDKVVLTKQPRVD